jgi:predicted Fe-Mo cluster-binding NifX family protein
MSSVKVAVATDDGVSFISRHFGDAEYYYLYEIDEKEISFIKRLANTSGKETVHADPVKAGGISALLKQEGVHAVIAKAFGPNIVRIKSQFVCVLMDDSTIIQALDRVKGHGGRIQLEWDKGAGREWLNLKVAQSTTAERQP